jgi:hypothetical protein
MKLPESKLNHHQNVCRMCKGQHGENKQSEAEDLKGLSSQRGGQHGP